MVKANSPQTSRSWSLSQRVLVMLTLFVFPAQSWAQDAVVQDDTGDITLDAGFYTALPIALGTGQTLGGVLNFAWRLPERGWFWGARARLGRATEYDLSWTVQHDEFLLSGLLGLRQRVGEIGEVEVGGGLGMAMVFEERVRHQGARLGPSGAATAVQEALSVAFHVDATLGVRLFLSEDWGLLLSGSRDVSFLEIASQTHLVWGWSAMLGVAWRYIPDG